MVSVQKINDQKFLVSLRPNSSLVGINRIIFISGISLVCGGIAITLFYLSFKWSDKKEKIFISQDLVTIEKGSSYAEYKWEEFRSFTSFEVTKDRREQLKLSFRSKGQNIEVGQFLNEEDKITLKDEVSLIIEELNLETFSSPGL